MSEEIKENTMEKSFRELINLVESANRYNYAEEDSVKEGVSDSRSKTMELSASLTSDQIDYDRVEVGYSFDDNGHLELDHVIDLDTDTDLVPRLTRQDKEGLLDWINEKLDDELIGDDEGDYRNDLRKDKETWESVDMDAPIDGKKFSQAISRSKSKSDALVAKARAWMKSKSQPAAAAAKEFDLRNDEIDQLSRDSVRESAECGTIASSTLSDESVSYTQTKRSGDASVTISAVARDMTELHKMLELAGLNPDESTYRCPEVTMDIEPAVSAQCDFATTSSPWGQDPSYTDNRDVIVNSIKDKMSTYFQR
jgi:hypothetical protein